MIRIFRDSTQPGLIPLAGTDGVMPYVNGDFAWSLIQVDRFTIAGRQVARIDVNGNAPRLAKILDVERFDATPATARNWIPQRNIFRADATIYCGKDNLDQLFDACEGKSYCLIVADWTGSPHLVDVPLPPGVRNVGTQFANIPGQFDVTAIYTDAWQPR